MMFAMEGVIVGIVLMSRIVVSDCIYVFNSTYLQVVCFYGMNTQMCLHGYV